MLNFAICDDNLNILDKMSKMLESIFTKNELDAKVALASNNVDKVLDYIYCNKTDVLFLDINLRSSKTGLEIAEAVRQKNKNIYIIFTTAHLEYAMVAYKFKTFDYLAKPITYERLEETIMRLYDDIYSKPKKYLKIDIVDLQRNKKDFLPKEKFRTCCPHMLPTKDLDYLEK